jgi:8-oxo-dGTP pyrophosphatase MutT (NUDIX family)
MGSFTACIHSENFESRIDASTREVREETGLVLTHIEGLITKQYPDRIDGCGMPAPIRCVPDGQGTSRLDGVLFSLHS